MCLPQVIKSFQNYRGVATTFYPTLVFNSGGNDSGDNDICGHSGTASDTEELERFVSDFVIRQWA